jgi:hypothetical protein
VLLKTLFQLVSYACCEGLTREHFQSVVSGNLSIGSWVCRVLHQCQSIRIESVF